MDLSNDIEFREICKEISDEGKSEEEWATIESDDMFQTKQYCGGFDATEMEFCFSFYDEKSTEYWFQVSLDNIYKILNDQEVRVDMSEAE